MEHTWICIPSLMTSAAICHGREQNPIWCWVCSPLQQLPLGYLTADKFLALKAWVGILLWVETLRCGKELPHRLDEVLHD